MNQTTSMRLWGRERAAARARRRLSYDSHPNWRTYSKLLELAGLLVDQLRPLGAKDNIDVQSFMWVASKYDETRATP